MIDSLHVGGMRGSGPRTSPRGAAPVGDGLRATDGVVKIAEMVSAVRELRGAGSDREQIDQIRALEELKSACAAAQAHITAAFAAGRRRAAERRFVDTSAGRPASAPDASDPGAGSVDSGVTDADSVAMVDAPTSRGPGAVLSTSRMRSILRAKSLRLARSSAAAEIALARRESPQRGGRFVGLAEVLVHEMPHTLHALAVGVLNEWRATIIVRETAGLTAEQRRLVDSEIAASAGGLDGVGDAQLQARVKKIAYRINARAVTDRAARAATERRVTLRPAPDCMAYLTQLLPMPTAVACLASLQRAADTHPGGDGRSRAQRMADEAAARLTTTLVPATALAPTTAPEGPCEAHSVPTGTDMVLNVIVSDETLFGDGSEPAVLPGNMPVPAPLLRRLIADLPREAKVWIRRLYTRPDTGQIAAMDSRQRIFTPAMRHLLFLRDHDTCRTPWCSAPARHADHVRPASRGGPTSVDNGQALSEDCNYVRTEPGWTAAEDPTSPGGILVTSPTGHVYPSPPRPATPRHRPDIVYHISAAELALTTLLARHP